MHAGGRGASGDARWRLGEACSEQGEGGGWRGGGGERGGWGGGEVGRGGGGVGGEHMCSTMQERTHTWASTCPANTGHTIQSKYATRDDDDTPRRDAPTPGRAHV